MHADLNSLPSAFIGDRRPGILAITICGWLGMVIENVENPETTVDG